MEASNLGARREAEKAWESWMMENMNIFEMDGSIPLEDVVDALKEAKAEFMANYLSEEKR